MTGMSFATTPTRVVPGERRAIAPPTPAASAPFPIGVNDGEPARRGSLSDLVADRLVRVVLQRLGAVLEEAQPRLVAYPRARPSPRRGRVRRPDVGAEPLEVRELLLRRPRWHEHDRADADCPARPRDGGAVIAGRGSDDGLVPVASEGFDDGQRASPFEDAELVLVLPLQPEVRAAREVAQRVGSTLEPRRRLHARTLAGARFYESGLTGEQVFV